MSTIIRTEKRIRSTFGKIVKWAFIAFNLLMIVWLIGGMSAVSHIPTNSDAQRVGVAIGAALGLYGIISIWFAGDIFLGLFVLLTRGNTVIVEETSTDRSTAYTAEDASSLDADEMIGRYLQRQQTALQGRASSPTPAAAGFGRRRS